MSPHLATREAEVDMKYLVSTRHIQLLVAVSLALVILPAVEAEPRCPGSVASVTPRFVQHALIVIPVRVNQAGPFDFMVDTGSQVTVIDPLLAAELNLKPQGRVGLVSVASVEQASVALLDTLEADSKVVEKSPAMVQDLRQIQAADPRIRGVLGESFLSHFDLLVDYGHKVLCLDETSAMRDSVRGSTFPLCGHNVPRMNCRLWNGWLFPFVSRALEPGRFCCSWIPAVTVRSFMQAASRRKSRHSCTPRLCREATQPARNGLLPSCHRRLCRSATIFSPTSHS
jgi:hypothetical protein